MSEAKRFSVPEQVSQRLNREGQLTPDMQVFRHGVDARVVFEAHKRGVYAYLQIEEQGQMRRRRLHAPSKEAAIDAAVQAVFVEERKPSTEFRMDFGKYGGKTT